MVSPSNQAARIRALEPINQLEPADQDALISEARVLSFPAGETVYTEGTDDDYANYLLEGSVEILWNSRQVKLIDARDITATQALDSAGKKRFTVRARSNSSILRVRRSQLEQKLRRVKVSNKLSSLKVSDHQESRWSPWKVRLLRSQMFKPLPMSHIQEIVHRLERIPVSTQEVVIQQGEPGDFYYIIDEGECTVSREPPGGATEIHVADLLPGEGFGEESLITGARRNATVRMKTDGHLLRMKQEDFDTWFYKPMVHEFTLEESLVSVNKGAAWVDVRPPDQFLSGGFEDALNIPLTLLRLECQKLSPKRGYVVCGNDLGRAAVGTLLLVQRGFQAACLNQTVAQSLDQNAIASSGVRESDSLPAQETPASTDTIVPFPRSPVIDSNRPGDQTETDMTDRIQNHDEGGSSTSQSTSEIDSTEPIPRDLYDDTYVGKSLADLIDQMQTRHQELQEENIAPAHPEEDAVSVIDLENFETEVDQALPPASDESPVLSLADETNLQSSASMPSSSPTTEPPPPREDQLETPPRDELAQLMQDFESKLRGYVQRSNQGQRQRLQTQLADRIAKVKQAAVQEVKRQAQSYREKYRADHAERERSMRTQYDKLMTLAHRISRQKAELQRARRELEGKLQATIKLQQEISGLRDALTQSIGNFDELEEDDSDAFTPTDLSVPD